MHWQIIGSPPNACKRILAQIVMSKLDQRRQAAAKKRKIAFLGKLGVLLMVSTAALAWALALVNG